VQLPFHQSNLDQNLIFCSLGNNGFVYLFFSLFFFLNFGMKNDPFNVFGNILERTIQKVFKAFSVQATAAEL